MAVISKSGIKPIWIMLWRIMTDPRSVFALCVTSKLFLRQTVLSVPAKTLTCSNHHWKLKQLYLNLSSLPICYTREIFCWRGIQAVGRTEVASREMRSEKIGSDRTVWSAKATPPGKGATKQNQRSNTARRPAKTHHCSVYENSE